MLVKNRHRYLLEKNIFDYEDKMILIEAVFLGDREVIGHCSEHGLKPDGYCLDANMDSSKHIKNRIEFTNFLISQGLTEGIGSFCAESLCLKKDALALKFLLDKKLLSMSAIQKIIQYATG